MAKKITLSQKFGLLETGDSDSRLEEYIAEFRGTESLDIVSELKTKLKNEHIVCLYLKENDEIINFVGELIFNEHMELLFKIAYSKENEESTQILITTSKATDLLKDFAELIASENKRREEVEDWLSE